MAYFGTTTKNLLAAEQRAGVRHHVLLSIVGIDRVEGNAHYAGQREQARLVQARPVRWTIVPATQFHDFAAMVTSGTEREGVATIAPLLVQPIAPVDIADVLAEVGTSLPACTPTAPNSLASWSRTRTAIGSATSRPRGHHRRPGRAAQLKLLIARGASVKVVQRRLGHASAKTPPATSSIWSAYDTNALLEAT